MTSSINSAQIKAKGLEIGFHKVGIASADATLELANQRLQTWLDRGYHANLTWMTNPKRQDIKLIMPDVQSIISVALNYYTSQQRPGTEANASLKYAKISRYGWGRDYHRIMQKKLKSLAQWLQLQIQSNNESNNETKEIKSQSLFYYVDTGPISDKVWAQEAGLGWIGKHGNLITREYGSWVFLGEILTNLKLETDRPHTEHCGTCTRCINACPTQAIVAPFIVNTNLCIAYHTIENRAPELPKEINLAGWVAGCDICQDVCPWNQKFSQETDIQDFQPYPENIAPQLSELAHISDQEWEQRFVASALRRIKPQMLRRNARHAMNNQPLAADCQTTNNEQNNCL